ncbi:hypothetical protein CWO_01200 [Buchnera aphidicola str. LL01 (Acyrthosiphon pisum)]|nr:hypothetical protein CWO_01200 [Buchnera aphidicola str. LL01 (Acyrthosiphon pisum)]
MNAPYLIVAGGTILTFSFLNCFSLYFSYFNGTLS